MITDESWKAAAHDLSDSLKTFKEPFKADFKEMIIVPDGVTWYVPLEGSPVRRCQRKSPAHFATANSLRADDGASYSAAQRQENVADVGGSRRQVIPERYAGDW